jgi:hypothetical protein
LTRAALVVLLLIAVGACSSDKPTLTAPAQSVLELIHLTSTAFEEGGTIPAKYTCDGDDVSPPLQWTGVPSGTTELRIEVIDPDARGFVHWRRAGISGSATSLPEGSAGWKGPCPPKGDHPHHYVFTLEARGATLAIGKLVGVYGR